MLGHKQVTKVVLKTKSKMKLLKQKTYKKIKTIEKRLLTSLTSIFKRGKD